MDKIEIIGDKIWLGGYVVAELKEDVPASVADDFRCMLEDVELRTGADRIRHGDWG